MITVYDHNSACPRSSRKDPWPILCALRVQNHSPPWPYSTGASLQVTALPRSLPTRCQCLALHPRSDPLSCSSPSCSFPFRSPSHLLLSVAPFPIPCLCPSPPPALNRIPLELAGPHGTCSPPPVAAFSHCLFPAIHADTCGPPSRRRPVASRLFVLRSRLRPLPSIADCLFRELNRRMYRSMRMSVERKW